MKRYEDKRYEYKEYKDIEYEYEYKILKLWELQAYEVQVLKLNNDIIFQGLIMVQSWIMVQWFSERYIPNHFITLQPQFKAINKLFIMHQQTVSTPNGNDATNATGKQRGTITWGSVSQAVLVGLGLGLGLGCENQSVLKLVLSWFLRNHLTNLSLGNSQVVKCIEWNASYCTLSSFSFIHSIFDKLAQFKAAHFNQL
jgi:hypothetical protein